MLPKYLPALIRPYNIALPSIEQLHREVISTRCDAVSVGQSKKLIASSFTVGDERKQEAHLCNAYGSMYSS